MTDKQQQAELDRLRRRIAARHPAQPRKGTWSCRDCRSVFTDPGAWDQHQTSTGHQISGPPTTPASRPSADDDWPTHPPVFMTADWS